jgi:hypothetical protein
MTRTMKTGAFALLAVSMIGVVAVAAPQMLSSGTPITESDATAVNENTVARSGQTVDASTWTVTAVKKKFTVSQP